MKTTEAKEAIRSAILEDGATLQGMSRDIGQPEGLEELVDHYFKFINRLGLLEPVQSLLDGESWGERHVSDLSHDEAVAALNSLRRNAWGYYQEWCNTSGERADANIDYRGFIESSRLYLALYERVN